MSMLTGTVAKGLVAGLAAGIIATGVKTVWEMNFPVRDESTDSPPVILADRALQAAGREGLSAQQKPRVGNVIHWTFGILVCVTYGVLAQKWDERYAHPDVRHCTRRPQVGEGAQRRQRWNQRVATDETVTITLRPTAKRFS
jgi:hypothetical protein